jgi:hypothetical protein
MSLKAMVLFERLLASLKPGSSTAAKASTTITPNSAAVPRADNRLIQFIMVL